MSIHRAMASPTRALALLCLLGAAASGGVAQVAAPPLGTWTGTSLCLQGRPVCKDERVVYRIARTGGADSATVALRMSANKIVRGAEESMGDLDCTYAVAAGELTCPMPPQFARGQWRFQLVDGALVGGLWLDGRGQVRTVRVRRPGA